MQVNGKGVERLRDRSRKNNSGDSIISRQNSSSNGLSSEQPAQLVEVRFVVRKTPCFMWLNLTTDFRLCRCVLPSFSARYRLNRIFIHNFWTRDDFVSGKGVYNLCQIR